MNRYKLTISYDGTDYVGWQIQPGGITIQGEIEKALLLLLRKETRAIGAGRTDTGVHALAQVAHFDTEEELDPKRFTYQMNGVLSHSIRIKEVRKVPSHFHAQRSASSKIYHYHLWMAPGGDPFTAKYHLQVHEKLSLPLLKEAAGHFVGKKDFASFTNVGSTVKTTVRTIKRIDVVEERGGLRLEFEGDGFLYKMVRNITGTLLEVGKGKRDLETLPRLLEGKDRRKADLSAAAKGLFLFEVIYPSEIYESREVEKILPY
jgi:tRNA pseudouridine38-40 synthase